MAIPLRCLKDQAPGVQRMLSSGQLELAELKDLIGSFQMPLTF